MSRSGTLLGVFVVVFVVTVGAVAVGGFVLSDDTPEQADLDTSQWELDNVSPAGADEGGELTMDSAEETNTVLVHVAGTVDETDPLLDDVPLEDTNEAITTGGPAGPERSVEALVSTLIAHGHEVQFYSEEGTQNAFGEETGLSDELVDVDAFVTTDPAALSSDARASVDTFAAAGGRVFVGADPGQAEAVAELGSDAGVYQDTGFLYNLDENDQNYLSIFAEPTGPSELTAGVDRVVLRGGAPITPSDGTPLLMSDDTTELSTTQRTDAYGVGVLAGNLTVVGDTSFMAPENAYRADNNVLIGNIADFLVTGEIEEDPFEGPQDGEQDPPTNGEFEPPQNGEFGEPGNDFDGSDDDLDQPDDDVDESEDNSDSDSDESAAV